MQQCTTRINPSEETIKIGPLSIRFLVTSEDSHGSASVFEFRLCGATTVLHRRQAEVVRHQQAWQYLSAAHADPRCSCGTVSGQVRHRRIRAVGASADAACSAQQSRGRNRQQTGSHGLGCTLQRQRLSAPAIANDRAVIRAVEKTLRLESTERFPLFHRYDIIVCPESDSPLRGRIHLRRLSLHPTSTLLQSGGGPYIIASWRGKHVFEIADWRNKLVFPKAQNIL